MCKKVTVCIGRIKEQMLLFHINLSGMKRINFGYFQISFTQL